MSTSHSAASMPSGLKYLAGWRSKIHGRWCIQPLRQSPVVNRLHTEASATPAYRAKRISLLSPTLVILGLVPLFTFGLGTWQMKRLHWKENLIEELTAKLRADPLPLPGQVDLSVIPQFVYRRVALRGKWDTAHMMLLGPRVRDGTQGYDLVVPLLRSNGSTVLVNRGFISKDVSRDYTPPDAGSEVEITALIRTSQKRNAFTPDNRPADGIWYWVDVDAMAEYAGGSSADVQALCVEEIFDGHSGEAASRIANGLPIGRPPAVDVRNAHMSYIITWYSLSAFTTLMFFRLMRTRNRFNSRPLPR